MNMKPVSSKQRGNRPDWYEYYINIAIAVRDRANCHGSKIGSILVLDNRILTTGYNGTPQDMQNCDEGGCDLCADRQTYSSGEAYDLCICVHAEQNTLLSAARFGISVEGADLYTTLQPCFGCTKELLQAKIKFLVHHNLPYTLRHLLALKFFQYLQLKTMLKEVHDLKIPQYAF